MTRGIRNCNPLNIRYSPYNDWLGKVKGDGVFERFESIRFGIRAWCRLIRNYVRLHHCSTIRAIVNRFAPPVENDTLNYVRFVEKSVGSIAVCPTDRNFMFKLCTAMWFIENGYYPTSSQYLEIEEGIQMYLKEVFSCEVD